MEEIEKRSWIEGLGAIEVPPWVVFLVGFMPALAFGAACLDPSLLVLLAIASMSAAAGVALIFVVDTLCKIFLGKEVKVKRVLAWFVASVSPMCGIVVSVPASFSVAAYRHQVAYEYCRAAAEEVERYREENGAYPSSIREIEHRLPPDKPALMDGGWYVRVEGGYLLRFTSAFGGRLWESPPKVTWDSRRGDWRDLYWDSRKGDWSRPRSRE